MEKEKAFELIYKAAAMHGFQAVRDNYCLSRIKDITGTVNFFTDSRIRWTVETGDIKCRLSFSAAVARCTSPGDAGDLELYAERLLSAAKLIRNLNGMNIEYFEK